MRNCINTMKNILIMFMCIAVLSVFLGPASAMAEPAALDISITSALHQPVGATFYPTRPQAPSKSAEMWYMEGKPITPIPRVPAMISTIKIPDESANNGYRNVNTDDNNACPYSVYSKRKAVISGKDGSSYTLMNEGYIVLFPQCKKDNAFNNYQ